MTVYAETSAVVAWLLGEEIGEEARDLLASADRVFVSILTLVELDRVLHRAVALEEMTEEFRAGRKATLAKAARHWLRLELTQAILERARSPFPREPVRTLDALHLGSALRAREAVGAVKILSFDRRIRENAEALGFQVAP